MADKLEDFLYDVIRHWLLLPFNYRLVTLIMLKILDPHSPMKGYLSDYHGLAFLLWKHKVHWVFRIRWICINDRAIKFNYFLTYRRFCATKCFGTVWLLLNSICSNPNLKTAFKYQPLQLLLNLEAIHRYHLLSKNIVMRRLCLTRLIIVNFGRL